MKRKDLEPGLVCHWKNMNQSGYHVIVKIAEDEGIIYYKRFDNPSISDEEKTYNTDIARFLKIHEIDPELCDETVIKELGKIINID